MSFSTTTKDELARIYGEKACCCLAELAALIRMDGHIRNEERNSGEALLLHIATENAAVARKILSMLKSLAGIRGEVLMRRETRLRKNNVYLLHIPPQPGMDTLFSELGINSCTGRLRDELLEKDCCCRAYLRGVFLGGGSVNNPEGTYHLELITNDEMHASEIYRLMLKMGMSAKRSKRKSHQVIYLKDSEQIILFLNIVGAHGALLNFENARIYKDMRNQVNRLVNCETANLHKTVNASVRQLENIKLIKEELGFERIPVSLRKVAELRINYPDACMKELGSLMQPPTSKSCINHRLRKIEKLAENIRNNKL